VDSSDQPGYINNTDDIPSNISIGNQNSSDSGLYLLSSYQPTNSLTTS
jgi:hypothetical protein